MAIDFRACLNALSDVIINRPPPLRVFDQIYMKLPDMLLQAELISRWFNDKRVLFVGDGDAIALSLVHLHRSVGQNGQPLLPSGPSGVTVLDFDERIVNSINQFAEQNDLGDTISAELYNVADPLPRTYWQAYDAFYTNPPWGKSNNGSSVCAFIRRGIESVCGDALGCIVVGDHRNYPWTHEVLRVTQQYVIGEGFWIAEMLPEFHHYHLDDAPDLTSCSLVIRRRQEAGVDYRSEPLSRDELVNFYGADRPLMYQYVLDLTDGGKFATRDVKLQRLGEAKP